MSNVRQGNPVESGLHRQTGDRLLGDKINRRRYARSSELLRENRAMPRVSRLAEELKNHYEIVVIGSGYGGSIAASRLARAKRQVCLLERGREFRPGEYPSTQFEGLREIQYN